MRYYTTDINEFSIFVLTGFEGRTIVSFSSKSGFVRIAIPTSLIRALRILTTNSISFLQLSFQIASLGFIYITDTAVDYINNVEPLIQRALAASVNSTFLTTVLTLTLDGMNAAFIGMPGKC